MHWKLKARLQNAAAMLPPALGNRLYYFAQRRFLGLRATDPCSRIRAGMEIVRRIEQQNRSVANAVIVEIGTGHQLNLPLTLWLCGAARVITVDLNRYLKAELVRDDLASLRNGSVGIGEMFGGHAELPLFRERFALLERLQHASLRQMLETMNITYLAPSDAARLDLADNSIDYHVSYTVLEHIPPATLAAILREGKRILTHDGLFVHCIDFSDHFSHSDSSISPVNFLQYSDEQWAGLAGNRYMYHNRMRVDDFRELLAGVDVGIKVFEASVDAKAQRMLENRQLTLDERFAGKSPDVNAASHAWVVGTPGKGSE